MVNYLVFQDTRDCISYVKRSRRLDETEEEVRTGEWILLAELWCDRPEVEDIAMLYHHLNEELVRLTSVCPIT